MFKTLIITTSLLLSSSAFASTAKFDKAMGPIVKAYLVMQSALATDSVKGVAASARKIATLARKLSAKGIKGEQAKHYQALPKKIRFAAVAVSKANSINVARNAFKLLSQPMALWAGLAKPKGVNVVYCSMAKGSWLQKGKGIRNPYYGAKMLKCGSIVK